MAQPSRNNQSDCVRSTWNLLAPTTRIAVHATVFVSAMATCTTQMVQMGPCCHMSMCNYTQSLQLYRPQEKTQGRETILADNCLHAGTHH